MTKIQPVTKEELHVLVQDESVYLGNIDTSLITDMSRLFYNSKRQNFAGIETWDVSHVTNMAGMFYGTEKFNQPIGSWDVSNVTNMARMFYDAESFNQDISQWKISKNVSMLFMFVNSTLSGNPPAWYNNNSSPHRNDEAFYL